MAMKMFSTSALTSKFISDPFTWAEATVDVIIKTNRETGDAGALLLFVSKTSLAASVLPMEPQPTLLTHR